MRLTFRLLKLLLNGTINVIWVKTKFQYFDISSNNDKKNKQRVISVPYNSSTNPVESLDYIF